MIRLDFDLGCSRRSSRAGIRGEGCGAQCLCPEALPRRLTVDAEESVDHAWESKQRSCKSGQHRSLDRYDPEWDSNPTGFGPVIVVGGQDFVGAPVGQGIGLTVLGNAPIVDAGTGTWLQVSRSDWDCVILLAQARAAWKQGGAEFKASLELEKAALQMAAAENTRLRSLGAFSDVIDQRGNQQERDMNRFNNSNKGK